MKTIFLVMEEHPYGREMFRVLLNNNLIPMAIIEESSEVSSIEREKFLKRINGEDIPPTFTELIRGTEISRHKVANHNSNECFELVLSYVHDWIILGGTRIIRGKLLDYQMLNVHPGLLPWMRGSSAEAWSIYEDIPVGVTCHKIDRGVDTGPILLRKKLKINAMDTYESIVRRNITLAAETMVEALHLVNSGQTGFINQDLSQGCNHKVISPELLIEVREKLAQNRYTPCSLSLEI